MRMCPALEVSFNGGDAELLQAALIDYRVAAVEETTGPWRVFFLTGAERDRASQELPRQFPGLSFQSVDVPDDDWAARSQASRSFDH